MTVFKNCGSISAKNQIQEPAEFSLSAGCSLPGAAVAPRSAQLGRALRSLQPRSSPQLRARGLSGGDISPTRTSERGWESRQCRGDAGTHYGNRPCRGWGRYRTCLHAPETPRRVGLDDPQRSLPSPTILWFCREEAWLVLAQTHREHSCSRASPGRFGCQRRFMVFAGQIRSMQGNLVIVLIS